MIPLLLHLLVLVIVGFVAFLVARYFLDQAEAEPPIRKIVLLILLIVFLLLLVGVLTGTVAWDRLGV